MTVVDFNFPGIFAKSVLSKAVVNILEKAYPEDRLSKLNFEDFGYNLESYPVPDGCRTLSHNILESQADSLLSQVTKECTSIFLKIWYKRPVRNKSGISFLFVLLQLCDD